jgi:hypothetical protein
MNNIEIKEIKKVWFQQPPFLKRNKYILYLMAELSDNNVFSGLKKISIKEISKNYLFIQSNIAIKINEEEYNYFIEVINKEKELSILTKIINNKEEKINFKKVPIEQKYSSFFVDCEFEYFNNQEEYYIKEIEMPKKDMKASELSSEIFKTVSSHGKIPSYVVKINLFHKRATIKKSENMLVAEYLSEKENKILIYKDYNAYRSTLNGEYIKESSLTDIIDISMKYENSYTLIDYDFFNGNYIIKGMYIKSGIINDKLIYMDNKNLLEFFKEDPYEYENNKLIISLLESSINAKKVENF